MKIKLAREPKEREPKFETARERGEHERICRQCSGARRAGAAALVLAMELTHERLASKIKRKIFRIIIHFHKYISSWVNFSCFPFCESFIRYVISAVERVKPRLNR